MNCELFESFGSVYANTSSSPKPSVPARQSSGFWEQDSQSMVDDPELGENKLRHEALEFMFSWATKIHPSDEEFNIKCASEGFKIAELLCSLSNQYFNDEFVDRVYNENDSTTASKVRRIDLIRQEIHKFYHAKLKYDLENAPMYFVEATEIAEQNDEALLSLMILIYGISTVLKNNCNKTFTEMLEAKPKELQDYVNGKEKALIDHMQGGGQNNYAEVIKDLRLKIIEKDRQLVNIRDSYSRLEFENANMKDELTRYAENSVINQELQHKISQSQQLEKQIKEDEELIRKLEADLREQSSICESLKRENSSLKYQLDDIREELRDVKDEKANSDHRLANVESRANEFEQKYLQLRDNNNQLPSRRDYDALMERNMKNLKIISEFEQKNESLENYRVTLSSRDAQLTQLKHDHDELQIRYRAFEQDNRALKKQVKLLEQQVAANTFEPAINSREEVVAPLQIQADSGVEKKTLHEQISEDVELSNEYDEQKSQNDELIKLQVANSRLEDDKQSIEEELKQQKSQVTESTSTSSTAPPTSFSADLPTSSPADPPSSSPAALPTTSSTALPASSSTDSSTFLSAPWFRVLIIVFVFLIFRLGTCYAYDEDFTVFGTYPQGLPHYMPGNDFQLFVKKFFSFFSKF